MRIALTATLLVCTIGLIPLPDSHAARGDLPTVAARARRCERIGRRLASEERRNLARPGCEIAATPGDPDAGFVKENDPLADPARIPGLVQAGYIVRTRADADTVQARAGDTTQRDAALASGAQYVSTDYPVPDPDFGTGYLVAIPDGSPGRCNPVNAPAACRSDALEIF